VDVILVLDHGVILELVLALLVVVLVLVLLVVLVVLELAVEEVDIIEVSRSTARVELTRRGRDLVVRGYCERWIVA
jgi:hypothetical protein